MRLLTIVAATWMFVTSAAMAQIAIVNPRIQCDGKLRSYCSGLGSEYYRNNVECQPAYEKSYEYMACLTEAEDRNRRLTRQKVEKPGVGHSCHTVYDHYLNRASDIIFKERSAEIVRLCEDGNTSDAAARRLMVERTSPNYQSPPGNAAATRSPQVQRERDKQVACEMKWQQHIQYLPQAYTRNHDSYVQREHVKLQRECPEVSTAIANDLSRAYQERSNAIVELENAWHQQQQQSPPPQTQQGYDCEAMRMRIYNHSMRQGDYYTIMAMVTEFRSHGCH